MVKVVFKDGMGVTVDTAAIEKSIMPRDENDWELNVNTEADSVTILDCDRDVAFCGKWSEVLYIQRIKG